MIKLETPDVSNLQQIARLDPILFQKIPIFKPLKRGVRPRLDTKATFNGVELHFSGEQALNIPDQDTFISILAIALPVRNGILVPDQPQSESSFLLREQLKLEGEDSFLPCIQIDTTAYEILQNAKQSFRQKGGSNQKVLMDSIIRLASVRVIKHSFANCSEFNLISYRKENDQLSIMINPHLSKVLIHSGQNNQAQHIKLPLNERRILTTEPARALHFWLVSRVRFETWKNKNKKAFRYSAYFDTLIERVWGDIPTVSGTIKSRRHAIKDALSQISQLPGWHIGQAGRGSKSQAIFTRKVVAQGQLKTA